MSNILIYSYVGRIYLIRHVKTYRVGIVMPTYIFNYLRDLDYYTSDYFFISTTNDLILVRNDMSPSAYPTSRKTIHWIVLLGRVTRGEGIKPLLEIKDFGPPARGGH